MPISPSTSPTPTSNACSRLPRYVLKAGQVVVDDTELRAAPEGHTLHVAPDFDPAIVPDIAASFDRWASFQFANFPVSDDDTSPAQVVKGPPS